MSSEIFRDIAMEDAPIVCTESATTKLPILQWNENYPINKWTSFKSKNSGVYTLEFIIDLLFNMNCAITDEDSDGRLVFSSKDGKVRGSIGIFDNGIVDIQRLNSNGNEFFSWYKDFMLHSQVLQPCQVV